MEIFAILLSVPAAFVVSSLYCVFLVKAVSKHDGVSRQLRLASLAVLVCFSVELLLLITLGAVRSRGLLGPGFYVSHLLLFFLGPPALANILLLRPTSGSLKHWCVAAVLCTVFAFFLVLLQCGVSESLYGIDGESGLYSKPCSTCNGGAETE